MTMRRAAVCSIQGGEQKNTRPRPYVPVFADGNSLFRDLFGGSLQSKPVLERAHKKSCHVMLAVPVAPI